MAQKTDCSLIVAAIDFGTTFSGYAYSFRHEYESDPLQIYAKNWCAGGRALISSKTPTCILFDPSGEFHSFGYEAEDKYSDLALDGDHREWYFFRCFKMKLYENWGVKRDMVLEDDKGKTMSGMKVFSSSICYLKDHMMQACGNRLVGFVESDIKWVLTVPAIWNDASKQFMREAAEQAGIPGDRLLIALEPEAASLYCKFLPVSKLCGETDTSGVFAPASKYLVLDAGGGTVDITVHEIQANGTIKELFCANGGNWGGTTVDKSFKDQLADIVGNDVFDCFCSEHTADFIDIFREFEVKKRTINSKTTGKITFKVPIALSDVYKALNGKELSTVIPSLKKYCGKLTWTSDKLRVDPNLAKELFNHATHNVVKHLQKLYKEPAVKSVPVILMVGGFAESPMLRAAIEKSFPDKRIITPEEAGLVVLKGAVIFGHNPKIIRERVAKFTYGIRTSMEFQEGNPSEKLLITDSGESYCTDIFNKQVEVGSTITIGEHQCKNSYSPFYDDQNEIEFDVFYTVSKNPHFTTDAGCHRLGSMTVFFPDRRIGETREIITKLTFSETEIKVEAEDQTTGNVTKAFFDFLG